MVYIYGAFQNLARSDRDQVSKLYTHLAAFTAVVPLLLKSLYANQWVEMHPLYGHHQALFLFLKSNEENQRVSLLILII